MGELKEGDDEFVGEFHATHTESRTRDTGPVCVAEMQFLRVFGEGWDPRMSYSPLLIPPFAKNAKDGAPGAWWSGQSKKESDA